MSRLPLALGLVLVAAAAFTGGRDLVRGIERWHVMGPLPPGEAAPQFRLYVPGGGTMPGEQLHGAVTVMTFWATWCGVCRGELEDLDELAQDYDGREDVRFVAVNHEGGGLSRPQVEGLIAQYRAKTGLQLPVMLDDGSASRSFRVRPIPHTVVLDPEGMIRYVHLGRVSASTIRAEIDRLAGS